MKIFLILLIVSFNSFLYAALHADTVWEFRENATANMVNGGGFNASNASPGTDYSQQTAAQFSGTDLACADGDAAAPVVTSATHNFVAADNGNIIHITAGTGWTAGWYEIVSTSGNAATLDKAVGTDGAKTNGTWYEGGALSLNSTLDDDFFEQMIAGNICYFKKGTYTCGEAVTVANDGTVTARMKLIGYKTTRLDTCVGSDRPTIAVAANQFLFDNYWEFRNFIITETADFGFGADTGLICYNVKATQSSATADRDGIYTGGSSSSQIIIEKCEAISTAGDAIQVGATTAFTTMIDCYLHDSKVGYNGNTGTNGASIINSVIDTCATGIIVGGNDLIVGNVIYGCTTGISGVATISSYFLNNIISGNTTGASWSSTQISNVWRYNQWNNTTDTSNVTKGVMDKTGNPLMCSPENANFNIVMTSPCLNAAAQLTTNDGVLGSYPRNIGVDQHCGGSGSSKSILSKRIK